jgi:hypothetical protein
MKKRTAAKVANSKNGAGEGASALKDYYDFRRDELAYSCPVRVALVPVVGREWGILWLLPLRRPSHRTSTEQETNCCTGWCDGFVSCRRPKAAGPFAGLWRHGSKQAAAMPHFPNGAPRAGGSEGRW